MYVFMSGNISCSTLVFVSLSMLAILPSPATSLSCALWSGASPERLVRSVPLEEAPPLPPRSDAALSSTSPKCALPEASKPVLSSSRAEALIESSVSRADAT